MEPEKKISLLPEMIKDLWSYEMLLPLLPTTVLAASIHSSPTTRTQLPLPIPNLYWFFFSMIIIIDIYFVPSFSFIKKGQCSLVLIWISKSKVKVYIYYGIYMLRRELTSPWLQEGHSRYLVFLAVLCLNISPYLHFWAENVGKGAQLKQVYIIYIFLGI